MELWIHEDWFSREGQYDATHASNQEKHSPFFLAILLLPIVDKGIIPCSVYYPKGLYSLLLWLSLHG